MKKIPSDLCLIVSCETVEDNCDLDLLLKVLGKEIEARERASMNTTPSPLCAFCDQPHFSIHCRVVTDHENRKQLLLKAGRCFICLKKGHFNRDCRSSRGCYNCDGRHHSSICKSRRCGSKNAQNTPSTSAEQVQNTVRSQTQTQQRRAQSALVLSMYDPGATTNGESTSVPSRPTFVHKNRQDNSGQWQSVFLYYGYGVEGSSVTHRTRRNDHDENF